eukprot:COSAG01_NODE_2767_length_7108_cov_96.465402_5_plen_36_part_00
MIPDCYADPRWQGHAFDKKSGALQSVSHWAGSLAT